MGEATIILDGLTLTEAPRWHGGRIWFSDLYSHRVCSAEPDGADLRTEAQLDGPPCGLGWLPDGRPLIVDQANERVLRREESRALVVHADLADHAVGRPNDLAVASDGTAYLGCWGFDIVGGDPVSTAPLLRVAPDGQVTTAAERLHFPNGCLVIDDTALLVAESLGNRISRFDIDAEGELGPRQDWATFGPLPTAVDLAERYAQVVVAADGLSPVDAEGAVWVADFTKRHAVRVLPGGTIVDTVSTGEHNCYAVTLGGVDGRTLFLCATRAAEDEMDPQLRARDPQGTIQVSRVDVPLA